MSLSQLMKYDEQAAIEWLELSRLNMEQNIALSKGDADRADSIQKQINRQKSALDSLKRKVLAIHADAIEGAVSIVSQSATHDRRGLPKTVQVVIRAGRESWTRHLRLQSDGFYTMRAITDYIDTFFKISGFALFETEAAQLKAA